VERDFTCRYDFSEKQSRVNHTRRSFVMAWHAWKSHCHARYLVNNCDVFRSGIGSIHA